MNRETAESYIIYGTKSSLFSKNMVFTFLPFNITLFSIAVVLFYELWFVNLVLITVVINMVSSLLFKHKWSTFVGLLSQGSQLFFTVIALDFVYLGMYKVSNLFIWHEYLVSISLQILMFILSIYLVLNLARKQNQEKRPVSNTVSSSVAGLSFMIATIFAKIFMTDVSLSIVITVLGVLINLMIYLLSYVIVSAYYRAYLTRKFNLSN